jgi:hypothetical protein
VSFYLELATSSLNLNVHCSQPKNIIGFIVGGSIFILLFICLLSARVRAFLNRIRAAFVQRPSWRVNGLLPRHRTTPIIEPDTIIPSRQALGNVDARGMEVNDISGHQINIFISSASRSKVDWVNSVHKNSDGEKFKFAQVSTGL